MKKRQDSWTSDEDLILAETVLRYIRNGKTQLEAFEEASEKLSRTKAACGFRWNATLRKQYLQGIEMAKVKGEQKHLENRRSNPPSNEQSPIEQAISLLQEIKLENNPSKEVQQKLKEIERLKDENSRLKEMIKRYKEAWYEMKNVWEWAQNKNEH